MTTLLERSNSTNPGMLRVMALCHESCKVLSEYIQVPLPDSTQLASRVAYLESMITPVVAAPADKPRARPPAGPELDRAVLKAEVREFVDLCDAILTDLDDVPEAGEEYAASSREFISGMRATAASRNFVTEKMLAVAEDKRVKVDRWLHRD